MKAVREKQKRKETPKAQALAPAVPPQRAHAWRRHAILLGALTVAALLAYSNSFSAGFVFDNSVLMKDSRIKAVTPENIDLIWNQEYWYNWSISGLYRPLSTFSYLFNYAVLGNGEHPAGYHWINFFLHAVNMALVYALSLLLLGEIGPAFAMAAVWSLHPLLTESITNIIGRSDLLSAFGVLAGFLCYVRATSASGRSRLAWLFGVMLATGIGAFSKESAVVVVAVIVIYDFTFRRDLSWGRRAPGYAAVALPLLVYFFIRDDVMSKLPATHFTFGDNPLIGADFWTSRLTAIKVLGKYLWLLVWPRHLSADYSYNQIPLFAWKFNLEDWKAIAALLACLAAAAIAVLCYRRRKTVFFFIAFFFAALAPTSNLVMHIGTIMAERFLYLPSIGFAGCLAIATYALWQRVPVSADLRRALAPATFALICVAFAARTYARNVDWHDEKSLFASAVENSPASYKAHMSLGAAWNDGSASGLAKGLTEIGEALRIVEPLPDYQNVDAAYINAGAYYRQKGDLVAHKNNEEVEPAPPEAAAWYRKSLEALQKAQQITTATNQAVRRDDLVHGRRVSEYGWYQLDVELGRTYLRVGQPRQALEALDHGRRRRPVPIFFVEMAAAWVGLGDLHKAALSMMEGLLVDPGYPRFAPGMVEFYQKLDPQGCAVRNTGKLSINLECPLVHNDICTASRNVADIYIGLNQRAKAGQIVHTAVNDLGCK